MFCTMFEATNLYTVLQPLLYVTKLFGLSPFNLKSDGPTESKFYLAWTIVLMSTLTGYSLFSLFSRPQKHYGLIMKIGDGVSVYLNVLSMFLALLCGCIFRKTIMEEIKNIFYLDKELERFKYVEIHKSYRKSKKLVILVTVLLIIYLTASLIHNIATFYHSNVRFFGEVIAYVWPIIINAIMELEFCTMVLILRRRFYWINSKILEIGDFLKATQNVSRKKDGILKFYDHNTGKNQNSRDIVTVMIAKTKVHHQRLCTTSKQLNRSYSIQILLMVITTFLNSIMTLFYWAIDSSLPKEEQLTRADQIYLNNGFAFAVLQILVIVLVCSTTAREAKRTGSLIHDIMPPSEIFPNRRALQIQLSSFSLQLANYNVEFNACGVFPINESLLYSVTYTIIVGAASAYLVIVIQFELSNRSSNNTLAT